MKHAIIAALAVILALSFEGSAQAQSSLATSWAIDVCSTESLKDARKAISRDAINKAYTHGDEDDIRALAFAQFRYEQLVLQCAILRALHR